MTEIKLMTLAVDNFKGIKSYRLAPEGASMTITGRNATGKTSLFDAFTWLLFGKDSRGASKFQVKPRDEAGNEIEGAEPHVEAVLQMDGKLVTLQRDLKENWVQHKGQLEKERKSDTSALKIDSVPKKLKEYQDYISQLIDEDLFKLLTVPGAFNALKVDQRRDILMGMLPEISTEDVVASDAELVGLDDILGGKTVDERRKQIVYERRELKKDIDGIPARIDEAERAKPTPQATEAQLLEIARTYESQANDLADKLQVAKAVGADTARQQAIADARLALTTAQTKWQSGANLALESIRKDIAAQREKLSETQTKLYKVNRLGSQLTMDVQALTAKHDELLEAYHAEAAVTFDDSALVCPTCGQELPEDKAEDIRKHFNVEHSDKLAQLIADGKQTNTDLASKQSELDEATSAAETAKALIDDASVRLDDLQTTLTAQQAEMGQWEDTDEYKALTNKLAALEADKGESKAAEVAKLESDLAEKQTNLQATKDELGKYDAIVKQDQRIAELKEQETMLKQQAAELDKADYMLQEYTRAKSGLIESKLNQLFSVVKFQLFDETKDGNVVDVVRTTVGGIDYDAGLNTGARMRAGLDIINALDRQHDVQAPIFVDDAESLSEPFATYAQQIRLRVTDEESLTIKED